MFKQVCFVAKNSQGYYLSENGELVFEDSSKAKRFHFIADARKEINDRANWSIFEVEYGFRVIRTIETNGSA